jgi:hypothetical protein
MCAFSAVLTTPAHSPEQPAVVSDLPLHERSRRAHLHHQCSTTTSDPTLYIATSSCVRGARISASFHHSSRRDNPSSDTARVTIKKISLSPTSRRSSHAPAGDAGRAANGQRSIRPGGTGFRHPQPAAARPRALRRGQGPVRPDPRPLDRLRHHRRPRLAPTTPSSAWSRSSTQPLSSRPTRKRRHAACGSTTTSRHCPCWASSVTAGGGGRFVAR